MKLYVKKCLVFNFHIFIIPSVQRPRSTRSSSVVTLARPPTSSSLKITDRSFRYASPYLWNQLPLSLREPYSGTSSSISYKFAIPIAFLFLFTALLSHNSISPTPGLKPTCFTNTTLLPRPPVWTVFTDYIARTVSYQLLGFLFLVFPNFFRSCSVRYRLGWLSCQLLSARRYTVLYRIVSS